MNASARVTLADDAARAPLAVAAWREAVVQAVERGARLLTLFGRRRGDLVRVTAWLESTDGRDFVLRADVDPAHGYHAFTERFAAFHAFERELHEQFAVRIPGHPWPKPVRFEGGAGQVDMSRYPWHRIEGKEVHEVAVGPIHAGVIEPGSFRFLCHGERVFHLEIQLGYQHRGVERLALETPVLGLLPLVETAAGDSSIAYAWAAASALERLAGVRPDPDRELVRGVLLELERVAMHLASLSGLAADVACLQAAAAYGRLRTSAINTTMRLCGSRFGRGAVRAGGSGVAWGPAQAAAVRATVATLQAELPAIDDFFLRDAVVRHRLKVGVLPQARAAELGVVGPAARASGLVLDRRLGAGGAYGAIPIVPQIEASGDCMGRARVRARETTASLHWLNAATEQPREVAKGGALGSLRPNELVFVAVEGWRGEVVHALETDAEGRLAHYKLQDPSFRNWMGLAIAMREQEISDFPICNKSFDLSYCGHDL